MGLFPFWLFLGACFEEGYPGGDGATEPNVAAQWLFDEASGSIVDEVGGVTLAASGTPVYGVTALGRFRHLAPGITFDGSSYFYKASATPELDLGTSDFVFETWFTTTVQTSQLFFACGVGLANHDRYSLGLFWSFGQCYVSFSIRDGVSSTGANVAVVNLADGVPHKIRVVGNRAGNLDVYVDESLQGSADISTAVAYDVSALGVYVGSNVGGASTLLHGTLYELRITVGNATNNSTPVWYP